VLAVQRDFRSARLSAREVEMLRYAETIAEDATRVTPEDIARLRAAGFADVQICDIALCVAFRCFVSRFFDAVGAGPEPAFIDEDAGFRDAMTVGRPIRPIHPVCDFQPAIEEEKIMATNVKQMMEAANAAVPRITPAQAQEMIAKGNTLVVDVRDAPEVEKSGKVPGAVNVSRGMLEFRADPETPYHDKNFSKDKTIILYCASGGRSALSGKVLKDMGYADVCNLGAFKDWAESGAPVEPPGT
jgi:rhodanese-related sulfurtransferase